MDRMQCRPGEGLRSEEGNTESVCAMLCCMMKWALQRERGGTLARRDGAT